jgi:hypothetical protein
MPRFGFGSVVKFHFSVRFKSVKSVNSVIFIWDHLLFAIPNGGGRPQGPGALERLCCAGKKTARVHNTLQRARDTGTLLRFNASRFLTF